MAWLKSPEARRLADKVAIVTGAGRGIGRVYAMSLAREGAKVCVADIRKDNGDAVAKEINDLGGQAIAVQVDVSDEESALEMAKEAASAFGGINILVNNAAIFGDQELTWDVFTGPMEYWDRIMSVNVKGVILCIRAVLPSMKERHGGVIVNQSSIVAFQPDKGQIGYTIGKQAVVGITMWFARRLAEHNIRVNALAPGLMETDALLGNFARQGRSLDISQIPMGRVGQPEDAAGGLLYLCSNDASFVTGETLTIDGGMWMHP